MASPEIYIFNAIKKYLNSHHGFNFSLLPFGTYAAARKAEMGGLQNANDMREYLGIAQPGGQVQKKAESILSHVASQRGMITETTTSTAAATIKTALAGSSAGPVPTTMATAAAAEQAEKMSFLRALWAIIIILPTLLPKILYNFVATLLSWIPALLPVLAAMALFFWIYHSFAYLPVTVRVHRGVWIEDIDEHYGLGDAIGKMLGNLLRAIGWLIIAPFRAIAYIYCFFRDNATLNDILRRLRAIVEVWTDWAHGHYLRLRYNSVIDTLRLWRIRTGNFINRNAFRAFWIALFAALAWRLWDVNYGKDMREGIVRFGSMREMAAFYGVPQDHFLHEGGGGWNARAGWKGWDGGEGVEMVRGGLGDEEIVSPAPTEVESVVEEGEGVEGWGAGGEGPEIVQSMVSGGETGPPAPKSVKRVVEEGRVADCRQCRQRHCCVAVE